MSLPIESAHWEQSDQHRGSRPLAHSPNADPIAAVSLQTLHLVGGPLGRLPAPPAESDLVRPGPRTGRGRFPLQRSSVGQTPRLKYLHPIRRCRGGRDTGVGPGNRRSRGQREAEGQQPDSHSTHLPRLSADTGTKPVARINHQPAPVRPRLAEQATPAQHGCHATDMALHTLRAPARPWSAWLRNLTRVIVGAAIVVTADVVMQMPLEAQGWAVVAYAVALGDTTGQSITAGWNRIKGTIVGVLVGAGIGYWLGSAPVTLRVCLALALTLLICQFVPVGGGLKLGVALSGFFAFLPVDEEIATGGWRFIATILGILIAIAVSVLLWPDTAVHRLRAGIASFAQDVGTILSETVPTWSTGRDRPTDPASLTAATARAAAAPSQLRALLADTHHELPGHGPSSEQYSTCVAAIGGIALAIPRLSRSTRPACSLAPHIGGQVAAISDDVSQALATLNREFAAGHKDVPVESDRAAAAAGIGDPSQRLEQAIEELRRAHVTQTKDAAELLDLFGVLGAMLEIAQGATAAVAAVAAEPTHEAAAA